MKTPNPRTFDKRQRVAIIRPVHAIATVGTVGGFEQADGFV